MSTLITFITVNLMCFLMSAPAADKSTQNLKDAYLGESTASAKYASYAVQAKKEGFKNIASLFEATSKSESIHAANHKAVLEKMGVKVDNPKISGFTVKSTKENLEDALKGETYEVSTMYPGFLTVSRSEDAAPATKSFTWAMDTEKKHMQLYSQALDALKGNKDNSLSSVYYVCPKCGNTYAKQTEKACSFCMTPSSKFVKFGV
ncbi:MAG: rubrerythrin family protein [Syntrophothermus sp.]